jgi:coenzyme PQQ precursor peptide PqqA
LQAVFTFDTPLSRTGTARPFWPRIFEIELKAKPCMYTPIRRRHGACVFEARLRNGSRSPIETFKEMTMQWTTPSFTDMRFGFEITMYIATR